ncbi:MAG: type II secretion system F family protein [Candidatus Nanohaloarchaea archaeon]
MTDLDKKSLKLKIRNFWREHEKLILLLSISFITGVALASINYINYRDTLSKFQLEEPIKITNQKDAEFTFNLKRPDFQQQARIKLKINNVVETPLQVYINGQRLEQVTGRSATITVSPDQLETSNTVRVTRVGLGFEDQKLIKAKVTSKTRFQQLMFVILNLVSILLVAAPIMHYKYREYQRRKEMEDKFPEFLRDVVEGTRAGMSLPQAIQNTESNSYGALSPKIEKMNAQLDWGIPFEDVLNNFGEETGSDLIKRSVDTIIQAYSSGGDIQQVLESVGENIRTIKQLKEKRESQLYGEMVTGYVVFFIFIGILVALTNFLLPNLAEAQQSLGGGGGIGISGFGGFGGSGTSLQENITLYKSWFKRLVYIQAIFSGLIIGKLSEGELRAGFKHMAILFALGYLAITFFL